MAGADGRRADPASAPAVPGAAAQAQAEATALAEREADLGIAAALLAIDPAGLGGVLLRAAPDARRERWLAGLRAALPAGTPWLRMPLHIDDERLLGGLDLGATVQAGRVIAQPGLLSRGDGGLLLVAMAERLSPTTAAHLGAALDHGAVQVQRAGLAASVPARLGVIALDEGQADDERVPTALRDRLALVLDWHGLDRPAEPADVAAWGARRRALDVGRAGRAASRGPLDAATDPADAELAPIEPHEIEQARARLLNVTHADADVQALCEVAWALGVTSLRAPLLALRTARAAAAWAGDEPVSEEDLALAARLVLAPRATRAPQAASDPAEAAGREPAPVAPPDPPQTGAPTDVPPDRPPEPPPSADASATPPPDAETPAEQEAPQDTQTLPERVLEAALASMPPGLLALLTGAGGAATGGGGRAGAIQASRLRGRPAGSRRGELRQGARLHLIDTLRAAAPWQALRQRELAASHEAHHGGSVSPAAASTRVQVRRSDFHVTRYRQRRETTTVFVVDASGSSALNRLAEAKGAVELLLADCYVRRDRVALIAFRGRPPNAAPAADASRAPFPGAELLLPPTRSLVRAKRSLAGLPGGGGTPLASGIDAARSLADEVLRRGGTPLLVLLTDGRANLGRDGRPGRTQAAEDALDAARALRALRVGALLLDTSPQPQPLAQAIAQAMGARYLPMPQADSRQLSQAARLVAAG